MSVTENCESILYSSKLTLTAKRTYLEYSLL